MRKTFAQMAVDRQEEWERVRREAGLNMAYSVNERKTRRGPITELDAAVKADEAVGAELGTHDFYGEVVAGDGFDAAATAHVDPFHFNIAVYVDGSVLTWNWYFLNGTFEGPEEGWEAEYEFRTPSVGDKFSLGRGPGFGDDLLHIVTWTGTQWELTTE